MIIVRTQIESNIELIAYTLGHLQGSHAVSSTRLKQMFTKKVEDRKSKR